MRLYCANSLSQTAMFQLVQPCSHVTFASAFASNFKNGFHGNKWWCSHLTLECDGKDQRKTQTQTSCVNAPLHFLHTLHTFLRHRCGKHQRKDLISQSLFVN